LLPKTVQYLQVVDHPGLVRDTANGAILSTSLADKQKYEAALRKVAAERSQTENLNKRVEGLENNLVEIKKLLMELLKKD